MIFDGVCRSRSAGASWAESSAPGSQIIHLPLIQFDPDPKVPKAKNLQQGCLRRSLLFAFGAAVLGIGHLIIAQAAPDQNIRQAMQQGGEAMAAGNFSEAIQAYSTVTRSSPAFAEGYLNLGLAQFQAGHQDEARTALEKALRLKPLLRGANLFLGIIAYRQGRFQNAEKRLERETAIDPRSTKAYLWLGISQLAENNPQKAIAALDKAYALDPKDIDILYQRGRAYYLVANASYAAMFQIDPDSVRVHQVLAGAYAQANRNQEAIAELETAVKMAPRQPGLHESLADQFWVIGQLNKAATLYREELGVDPYSVSSMYKLGSLLVLNQNPAEGVPLLRQTLKVDPGLSDAYYYLGDGLAEMGELNDAIRAFDQAIAADPTNDRAMSSYYKLVQIYHKLHDQKQAQAALANFLRMRTERQARRDNFTANIVRKRTDLPVEDPERVSIVANAP